MAAVPLFATIMTMMMMMVMFSNINQVAGLAISPSNGFRSGRRLYAIDNGSEAAKESDETVRVDPLDNFNKYRGGYDITNKHYWSSTAFTGIYGYAIAIIWLLCSLGYGVFLLANTLCCKNRRRKLKKRTTWTIWTHKQCYLWLLLSATFFTILAIIGCGLILGGNAKFHSRAKTVIDILIDTADDASETLYNTTRAMRNMSSSLGAADSNNVSDDALDFLITTSSRLDTQAADIQIQARKHRRAIDKGLTIVYIITTVIMSLNLVASIALSAFGVLKLQKPLRLLIVFSVVLTFLCWLFFGIYFFLNEFAGDTCTAFESFQQDPYNNTLSSILPCDELVSARSVIREVSEGIFDVVNEVNRNISTSYGNIVQICNPFSGPPEYEYQEGQNCPENTIRIGDIPQVLSMLTCSDSEGGTCNGGILIPARDFNTVVAYTSSIQNLLNVFPRMESLVECQTVRNAFAEILRDHCKPLKRYAHMVWAAMVFLAVVMVILVLIWTVNVHQEQNLYSFGGSVKPHSPTAETLESGPAKTIKNDKTPMLDPVSRDQLPSNMEDH